MQNQLYYNPTNDYSIIDLDEYLNQTGRTDKYSMYKYKQHREFNLLIS